MSTRYSGFKVGDRLRMIECKDPYAPIMSGEKGTVVHIDSLKTIHMSWDNGRTLGVIPEEDEVEKIPLDEEVENLHPKSAAACRSDEACEGQRAKALEAIYMLEATAIDVGGAWAVRTTFLDPAHEREMPTYSFVEAGCLGGLIDGADAKNGVYTGFHKAGRHRSFVVTVHGSSYESSNGTSHVREAFECRLLKKEVAEDYRERMKSAGWCDHGKGPENMFFSPADQCPLLLKECQKLLQQGKGRESGLER